MDSPAVNDFLVKERPGKLMAKYAVPCVISLLVAALYNIVDQIFIANADYLGSYGNAANTVVFPLTVFALAFAVMIGDGACAYVSQCLGGGRNRESANTVGIAVILSLAVGAVVTAAYLVFADPVILFFGGGVNPETHAFAGEYFFWISVGMPFYIFGQAMNPIIRSDGSPRFAMAATVAGAVTNLILDPIFIYPLNMGMTGAAVATVAGQVLTAALSLWYLGHMKAVRITRDSFAFDGGITVRFLRLGVTSFLAQAALVVSMAAVQNTCAKYGALDPVFGLEEYSQIPLAVLGIVMKFFQIAISVSIGMAAGCIPVVGYNIGAGRKDRARTLFTYLLISEAVLGFAALLVVDLLPRQLIGVFGASGESAYYTEFGVKCFRTYLCMMPLATVNKGTFIYLQGLGRPVESTLISLVREVVLGVALTILMPLALGLDGLLWSFPAADIITFATAAVIIAGTYRRLSKETTEAINEPA